MTLSFADLIKVQLTASKFLHESSRHQSESWLLQQADNTVVRTWGQPGEEADLHNHVDLVEMLDIVDLDKGVSIAGKPASP